tara:strand:+ start:948 stop:2924 length:1977 start_codon:yes stop_codon:yes gene_type:complete
MFSLGRDGVRDPRIESYNTFAGAAMASFMKIRSEINLAIWKMRLKMADPSSMIELEMDIEDRIDNKYKLIAELKGKNQAEKFKMIKAMTDDRVKTYQANMKFLEGLTVKQMDVLDNAIMVAGKYAEASADQESKSIIDGKLRSMVQNGEIAEYLRISKAHRDGNASAQEQLDAMETIKSGYVAGLGDALTPDRVTGATTKKGAKGEIAMEHAWLYAVTAPRDRLLSMKEGYQKEGKKAEAQDVQDIITELREITNQAKYPGTGPDGLDILNEHYRVAADRDYALESQRGLYASALKLMESSGRVLQPKEIKRIVEEQLNINPTLDIIRESIPRLERRLEGVSGRRRQREIEQRELLTGMGGMNLAFDPFSSRPSRRGDRMEALYRMGEAEQGLRDIAGVGEMTFPAGEGGNFSRFLKDRISRYQDKMNAAGGDKNAADFSGLADAMDQVSSSFKTFGGSLSGSDTAFAVSRKGLKPGSIVSSMGEVIAQYDELSKNVKNRDRLAAFALDTIGQGDSPVSRNYLKIQRYGTQPEKRSAAYNSVFMPLKTNIAVVLNPKIESMRAARDNDDIDGMVGAVQDIYQTVERMPEDLLGSAGVNIRAAIEDNPMSEEYIGGEPSIYRVSKLIDDQFISMNEQIINENEKAESILEQAVGEQSYE